MQKTVAPSAAKARQIAAPNPEELPVTTAMRPRRRPEGELMIVEWRKQVFTWSEGRTYSWTSPSMISQDRRVSHMSGSCKRILQPCWKMQRRQHSAGPKLRTWDEAEKDDVDGLDRCNNDQYGTRTPTVGNGGAVLCGVF
jgi:hypothetical protein